MDDKVFETDFAAFYGLFGGLSVEQATAKAKDMGLTISKGDGLVDIDYAHITATVTDYGICRTYDCWGKWGCYEKAKTASQEVIDKLSLR